MTASPSLALIETLEQTVEMVFSTMLNASIQPVPGLPFPEHPLALTAALHYTGPWRGVLMLDCDAPTAFWITRMLLGEAPAGIDSQVADAVGEVVNMIGGNLKSLLPPGSHISIPTVVRGADYALRLCTKGQPEHRAFQTGGAIFWVTILEIPQPA